MVLNKISSAGLTPKKILSNLTHKSIQKRMKMRHICLINTASLRSKEHIHSLVQIKNKIKKKREEDKTARKKNLVCFCREPLSDATFCRKVYPTIFLIFLYSSQKRI